LTPTKRFRTPRVIPPKANSTFVAAMEDVLAVYTRPRDGDRPLVCLDKTSKELTAETRAPIPMKAGRPGHFDYEYERNGTANLFMMFAPLEGWRHVKVTDCHTAVDSAHVLKDLADLHFPHANTIVLVQDNLNTHSCRRSQAAGRAIQMALHFKSTAVGSIWRSPNSASYRPSASTAASPTNKLSSTKSPPGSTTRNANHTKANWHFTTPNARIKTQAPIPFNLTASAD
jgi:DDE superfamily endonuclease